VDPYLVELYLPRNRTACDAAAELARRTRGPGVRYVRTIFLPHEETCFHEFEATDAPALRAALESASVRYRSVSLAEIR
jgi:hypothetical protein